ncbi:MAG: transposase family protein [Roseibium sp.]|nr:transposase family protein [Roseibium sp.]
MFGKLLWGLPDPRAGNRTHWLGDLMVMMVAAGLCGATTATEFALFTETRKAASSRLIDYDTAPSHDALSAHTTGRPARSDAKLTEKRVPAATLKRRVHRHGGAADRDANRPLVDVTSSTIQPSTCTRQLHQ